MKNKLKKILTTTLLFILFLFSTKKVFAVSKRYVVPERLYRVGVTLIGRDLNSVLDSISTILVLMATFLAIKVADLVRGGKLEKIFNFLAVSMGILSIGEAYSVLDSLAILHIEGLDRFLKIAFILGLLLSFLETQKILLHEILNAREKLKAQNSKPHLTSSKPKLKS